MQDFFHGVTYFIAGMKMIFSPGLRRFVYVPLFINALFFSALFVVLYHFTGQWNHWFAEHVPTWLQWLSIIFWLLFFISFFLILLYGFVTLANVICAPFNSFLAEKVVLQLNGKQVEQRTWLQTCQDIPRTIARQLALIGYYLPRALVLIILFFIPVVQIVATILWFIFNAWFMALTYIDYPTDNQRVPLTQVHTWLRERRMRAFGLGFSVLIASMIPGLNFIAMPAAVAAASLFWCDTV